MTTQVVGRIVEEAQARGDGSISAADIDGVERFLEHLSQEDPLTYGDFLREIDSVTAAKLPD